MASVCFWYYSKAVCGIGLILLWGNSGVTVVYDTQKEERKNIFKYQLGNAILLGKQYIPEKNNGIGCEEKIYLWCNIWKSSEWTWEKSRN